MTSGPCQARRYPDMCRSNGQEDTQNRPARTAEVDLQPYRPPHYQGAWGIASATANAVGVDIEASDGATSNGCGGDRRPTPRRHRNPTLSQRATRRSHSGRSPRFIRRLSQQPPSLALCGSCDARDGERIRSRGLSRTGVARVCGDVGSVAGWPSGREWNGLQSGQGAAELSFPRPALGKMQGQPTRRAGDPSHQSEDPPPEGLGDHGPLSQTNPRRPAGRLCATTWTASQAPLAAKRPDGMCSARRRT